MTARTLRNRWSQFVGSPTGRAVVRTANVLVTVGVIGYLVYRLSGIGWGRIWAEMPETVWFYLIFLVMYFTLPVVEAVIYGVIWQMPARRMLPATLKKRVYNNDVMGYTGEFYLMFWGRDRADQSGREVLHAVKDNTIVSSLVSTAVSFVLLGAFFFAGQLVLPAALIENNAVYFGVGAALFVLIVALVIRFRQALLFLPMKTLGLIAGLHVLRLIIVQGAQVLQWAVVLPEVSVKVWLTFLSVQILMNRFPVLPSRDLIFLGVGVEMSQAMAVPEAALASMLLVTSVMDKSLNVFFFGLATFLDRRRPALPGPETPPAEATPKEPRPAPPVEI